MIDAVYALNKMGLEPRMSVSRAIIKVGMDIADSGDPLRASNKIIVALGAKPYSKPIQAEIIAKALIEQAVLFGENYDAEKALDIALAKYDKIERTMPYVFAGTEESKTPSNVEPKAKRGGDKKDRALEIYNREAGKSGTEIAKIIAAEIDITYANAYYYVSRVFAKFKQ